MQFTVEKKAFADALAHVGAVIPNNSPRAILQNVLLEADSSQHLYLYGTDLEVSLRLRLDARVDVPGEILLPAKQLVGLAKRLSGDSINFTVADDVASISCGKGAFTFACANKEDYPTLATDIPDTAVVMAGRDFADAVAKTVVAVGKGETRYATNGLNISIGNGTAEFAATDTLRLSIVKKPVEGDLGVTGIVLVKGVTLAARLAAECEQVRVFISESELFVNTGNTSLRSRLIDGRYPAYQSIADEKGASSFIVERQKFLHALSAVGIVADGESGGLDLILSENSITIHNDTVSSAKGSITMEAVIDGPPITIRVNHVFLNDALRVLGSDEVTLVYSDNTSALFVVYGDYTNIVMPINR